jgi:hypothetical protein
VIAGAPAKNSDDSPRRFLFFSTLTMETPPPNLTTTNELSFHHLTLNGSHLRSFLRNCFLSFFNWKKVGFYETCMSIGKVLEGSILFNIWNNCFKYIKANGRIGFNYFVAKFIYVALKTLSLRNSYLWILKQRRVQVVVRRLIL